jgi:hypothetical protein
MRILVIFVSGDNLEEYVENITMFRNFIDKNYGDCEVDYACILSSDSFEPLEKIVSLKYKEVNHKRQLSKMCDFITKYKDEFTYDWFIKTRPEIQLNRAVDLSSLSLNSIHARAREYRGPKRILFGNSVGGTGYNKGYKASTYSEKEELVALDDQFYIFHRTVIELGAFVPFIPEDVAEWYIPDNNKQEHEWVHSNCWKSRNIHLNVIGIDILFERTSDIYAASGNINC